jgi:hypothetical protein
MDLMPRSLALMRFLARITGDDKASVAKRKHIFSSILKPMLI